MQKSVQHRPSGLLVRTASRHTPAAPTNSVSKKGYGLAKAVVNEMETGPARTVKARVTRVLKSTNQMSGLIPVEPGEVRSPNGGKKGRTLLNEIRQVLKTTCKTKDGRTTTRFGAVAEAFVEQMEAGEFPFFKEFIDREEGKVAGGDREEITVKLYAGVPLEGKDAP